MGYIRPGYVTEGYVHQGVFVPTGGPLLGNIAIFTPEMSDAAVLTADAQSAGSEAGNLQRIQPTDVWERPGSTGTLELKIDLGASWAQWSHLWLGFVNAVAASKWTIRTGPTEGDAAPGSGTETYDSGNVAMLPTTPVGWERPHAVHVLSDPATQADRWIFVRSAPGDYPADFEAGRLYVKAPWRPTINYLPGAQYPVWTERKRRSETEAGIIIPEPGFRRRTCRFSLGALSEADALGFVDDLLRLRGLSRDLLIFWDDSRPDYQQQLMVYGLLDDQPRAVRKRNPQWPYAAEFNVTELR